MKDKYKVKVFKLTGATYWKPEDEHEMEAEGLADVARQYDRRVNGPKAVNLPEDMKALVVRNMKPGDTGYAVPWAMYVASDGRMYLSPLYALLERPMGTAQMKIEREEDGYRVWPVRGRTYQADSDGAASPCPVVKLER